MLVLLLLLFWWHSLNYVYKMIIIIMVDMLRWIVVCRRCRYTYLARSSHTHEHTLTATERSNERTIKSQFRKCKIYCVRCCRSSHLFSLQRNTCAHKKNYCWYVLDIQQLLNLYLCVLSTVQCVCRSFTICDQWVYIRCVCDCLCVNVFRRTYMLRVLLLLLLLLLPLLDLLLY